MRVEKFHDGVAFFAGDNEVAFYSNITDRITYYPDAHPDDWKDVHCISIPYFAERFISNISEVYRSQNKSRFY